MKTDTLPRKHKIYYRLTHMIHRPRVTEEQEYHLNVLACFLIDDKTHPPQKLCKLIKKNHNHHNMWSFIHTYLPFLPLGLETVWLSITTWARVIRCFSILEIIQNIVNSYNSLVVTYQSKNQSPEQFKTPMQL